MVKRAFSRLGTITAGWGRSIRSKQSQLNVEDKKKWASSQDCSGEVGRMSLKGIFMSIFQAVLTFLFPILSLLSLPSAVVEGALTWYQLRSLLLLLAERKRKTEINLRIASFNTQFYCESLMSNEFSRREFYELWHGTEKLYIFFSTSLVYRSWLPACGHTYRRHFESSQCQSIYSHKTSLYHSQRRELWAKYETNNVAMYSTKISQSKKIQITFFALRSINFMFVGDGI